MSRVLGIVPARGGSKRVAGKNRRVLGGRPLVVWVLDAVMAAREVDRVVLSSDDEATLELGASYANALCLRRPAELSTDEAPAIGYVRHAVEELGSRGEAAFDAVAIVQPSSPFTRPEDIDAVVSLLEKSDADSAVSVMRVEHAVHPLKLKRLGDGGALLPYVEEERGRMSEHELPALYVRNGSVYVSRMSTIERGSIIGDDSRGFVMPRERSIDINDELDFSFAEFLAGRREGSSAPRRTE